MFTAGLRSNTGSECVFLCVRSSERGCVCDHCLSFNNRLSVAISGGWGPGDLACPCDWLARRSEKFTLEGAICWVFSLPIKCGMQRSRRPFEVCCVCMCMRVCACVCLSPYPPHSFLTQEVFQHWTSRAGKLGPGSLSTLFYVISIPSALRRRDLKRKTRRLQHNSKLFVTKLKSSHPVRNNTLCKFVCESWKTSGSLFTVCQRCLLSGCD